MKYTKYNIIGVTFSYGVDRWNITSIDANGKLVFLTKEEDGNTCPINITSLLGWLNDGTYKVNESYDIY